LGGPGLGGLGGPGLGGGVPHTHTLGLKPLLQILGQDNLAAYHPTDQGPRLRVGALTRP
jgi:hypothetical protein